VSGITKVIIAESADELKEKMNTQFKAREKERLQALYLLKSGKCQQIIEIAEILGRSRSTIHRWLQSYKEGGLSKLIQPGEKPGRKRLIPQWAIAKLEKRLQQLGLKTIERTKITARGVQPIGVSQWVFKTVWLYGIVEPVTGEYVLWEFSHLDSVCFEAFLDYFSQQYPDEMHIIQLDNSGAHTASQINLPDNIQLLFQPPYAPELNPIERLWKFIKDKLAWQLWTDLAELTSEIEFHIRQLTKPIIASLTGWDSILDALCVSGIF
jgi:putative transposase